MTTRDYGMTARRGRDAEYCQEDDGRLRLFPTNYGVSTDSLLDLSDSPRPSRSVESSERRQNRGYRSNCSAERRCPRRRRFGIDGRRTTNELDTASGWEDRCGYAKTLRARATWNPSDSVRRCDHSWNRKRVLVLFVHSVSAGRSSMSSAGSA